jgi:hypothetical protein
MTLRERFRRWWKPAQYDADHPLSEEERDAERPRRFMDERGKLDPYTVGGGPIDPDDDFRRR